MSRFTSFSLRENSSDAGAAGSHRQAANGLPDISDLSARLRFLPHDGQVWLDDQRMVLLNLEAMIAMRREIFEAAGPGRAREILFRMGHAAGSREAMLVLKLRVNRPEIDAFLIGPQLHALRGEVFVEPVDLEMDSATGRHYNELIWRNSLEAESHVASFGGSSEPVCWMQLGYASGYTSAIMERPIIFREVECIACGSPQCRIVGKPAEEWSEGPDLNYMPRMSLSARRRAPGGDGSGSDALDTSATPDMVVGASPGFLGAWHLLNRVAPLTTTVLLLGESGVGKEIFAHALHQASGRARRDFLSVNCAAIPENLVDAELFGVARGAYTGAHQTRKGWFEIADGNTLFLDEIGTLSYTAQAKLLRVLQDGQLTRVGETTIRKVDVRIVCATNVDLTQAVRAGQFRADLFHRLNVFPIHIPPLRERRDDIPPLIELFLKSFNRRTGRNVSGFTTAAVDALLLYDFPGNVRELENMVERAAILTRDGEPVDVFHLFTNMTLSHRTFLTPESDGKLFERHLDNPGAGASNGRAGTAPSKKLSLKDIETRAIQDALSAASGNVSKAARDLGLTRAQLRYRLRGKD